MYGGYHDDADCIVALSGGVESTALLAWLIENRRKPYLFHVEFKGQDKQPAERIRVIKRFYGVQVVTYTIDALTGDNGFIDADKTKQFYIHTPGQASPQVSVWATIAHIIQTSNPWIKDIYYGACFGGLLKHGDDEGDHMFGYLEQTIKSIKDLAGTLDIEAELSAPIGHMTKLEQWGIIDTEVQTQIWSCLTTNINQQCGKCYKCVDLEAVRNAVDFSK